MYFLELYGTQTTQIARNFIKTQVNKFLVRILETLVEKGAIIADRVAALWLYLTKYEAVSRDDQ